MFCAAIKKLLLVMTIPFVAAFNVTEVSWARQANENADAPENWLVFPANTELQRALIGEGSVVVLINGTAALKKDVIDETDLNLSGLKKRLQRELKPDGGTLAINVRYGQKSFGFNRDIGDKFSKSLEAFGRNVGFRKVRSSQTMYVEWADTIDEVTETNGGQLDLDEPGKGDKLIRIYPVNTKLSRYLTGNVDCVVDILAPLNKPDQATLNPEFRESILKYAKDLSLSRRSKINFQIHKQGNSDTAIEQFVDEEAKALANLLGFDHVNFTYHN